MRRSVLSSSVGAGLLVVGLGLVPLTAGSRHVRHLASPHTAANTDLDSFSDAQLRRDLQDELDDVLEDHAPDDVADVATMQKIIMEALSDDGDVGAEAEITLADLEDEMHEVDTSVEEVVHTVLEELDRASLDRPTVHLAVWGGRSPVYKPTFGNAVRKMNVALYTNIKAKK